MTLEVSAAPHEKVWMHQTAAAASINKTTIQNQHFTKLKITDIGKLEKYADSQMTNK